MLSVVIPAYNEEQTLEGSIRSLAETLNSAGHAYELLVVNDGSSDGTERKLIELERRYPALRHITNEAKHGFGHAVRHGLAHYRGDAVAIVMADSSDSPLDLVAYYAKIREGYQAAFGSRFVEGAQVSDYPRFKWILNRMGNRLIAFLFGQRYSDFTNPFKCYRREVIDGMQPLVSGQFNLAIEMSLKAVAQRTRYAVVPTSWRNRDGGASKFKVFTQARLYLLTLLYCLVVTKVVPILDRSAR
jgi:dolichol-phosphate mannosyltransferase